MKYILQVEYTGWRTVEVEADSLIEATEKASILPEDLLFKDLQYKEIYVEDGEA